MCIRPGSAENRYFLLPCWPTGLTQEGRDLTLNMDILATEHAEI